MRRTGRRSALTKNFRFNVKPQGSGSDLGDVLSFNIGYYREQIFRQGLAPAGETTMTASS